MEQVISIGAVAAGHQPFVLAHEQCRLQRHNQTFVRVEGDGIHILEGTHFLYQLLTHHKGTSEGCIHVMPDPIFGTYLANLGHGIDIALHSGADGGVDH